MDLNRQALLTMTVAVLGPAAVWHGAHPGALARAIGRQAVLPGTRGTGQARSRRAWASAWAGSVVVLELAVLAAAVVSLFTSTTRVAGAMLGLAGAAFVGYVALLLTRDYRGDCGCSPVAAAVTGLSLVPGAALLAAGVVLAVDHPFDDVALADGSGGLETALALAAAVLIGGLVSLLPASALVGDPVTLRPATSTSEGER
jgi:methylamine utilization protein MauE